MQKEKVLLRRVDDKLHEEVGVVTAQKGKTLSVSLPSGRVVTRDRRPDELNPDRWSYLHLLRIAPEAVRDALLTRPEVVFKQILREANKALPTRDLKKRLTDAAESEVVDLAWQKAKPRLESDPHVHVSKESTPTYRFESAAPLDFRALFPVPSAGRTDPSADSAEEDRSLTTEPSEPDGQHESPRAEALESPSPGPAPRTEQEHVQERSPRARDTTADADTRVTLEVALRRHLEGRPAAAMTKIEKRPLALAQVVSTLSVKDQRALMAGLVPHHRLVLAIACGRGKNGALAHDAPRLPGPAPLTVVRDALEELRVLSGPPRQALAKHLADLARRTAEMVDLGHRDLIDVSRELSRGPVDVSGLSWSLGELTRLLKLPETRSTIDTWDLAALVLASRVLPLDRDGARSSLLAALHKLRPDLAAQPGWWAEVGTPDLALAARGVLSHALATPQLVESVLAPAVSSFVADPSRSTISGVFSWPSPLAHLVSGAAMARLVGQVADKDKLVAEWVRAIADTDRVLRLEREVTSLRADAEKARDRADTAEAEAIKLRESLQRASEQLATARQSSSDASAAHDRQARIDGVRAVATLAAQVLQSDAASQDVALVRQVEHLCAREGLDPIEAVGDHVVFDPSLHDALTPRLSPGTAADVVRGGYTWDDGGERAVILKAQVLAAQE